MGLVSVNCGDTVQNTIVGKKALSYQESKVSNEPQTTVLLKDMQ